MGSNEFACFVFQSPKSYGEIRPCGVTDVASVITKPAPPIALVPRWTTCHSVGKPSFASAEYWHIGETNILLLNVIPRIFIGLNNKLICLNRLD